MAIDLLIKIFILFFIKIVNFLLHYAMEDRPVKKNYQWKQKEERGYFTSFNSNEKSTYINEDIFTFTDKMLTVISLSCWLFSEPLISTSL